MAYSVVGIVNLSLGRVGAKGNISALTENSPNAIKANAVWEYIRDLVLEQVKPKFATMRVALAQSVTAPASRYLYAYVMPSDYLCLADGRRDDPPIYTPGYTYILPASYFSWTDFGRIITRAFQSGYPYTIETLTDGTLCLFTDYDSVTYEEDLYISYVKRITDPQKFAPSFIDALTYRLAAEFAISIVESTSKFQAMITLYERALERAKSANRAHDYVEDEMGDDAWVTAGR